MPPKKKRDRKEILSQHHIQLYCRSCSIRSSKRCQKFKGLLTKFKGSHHQPRLTCRGLSCHLTSNPECYQLYVNQNLVQGATKINYFSSILKQNKPPPASRFTPSQLGLTNSQCYQTSPSNPTNGNGTTRPTSLTESNITINNPFVYDPLQPNLNRSAIEHNLSLPDPPQQC